MLEHKQTNWCAAHVRVKSQASIIQASSTSSDRVRADKRFLIPTKSLMQFKTCKRKKQFLAGERNLFNKVSIFVVVIIAFQSQRNVFKNKIFVQHNQHSTETIFTSVYAKNG